MNSEKSDSGGSGSDSDPTEHDDGRNDSRNKFREGSLVEGSDCTLSSGSDTDDDSKELYIQNWILQ